MTDTTPSTRVAEAELLEAEHRVGREILRRSLPAEQWQELQRLDVEDGRAPFAGLAKPESIARLVAEIRRYRTMLIGLKERTRDGFPDGPVSEFQTCLFCHRGEQHMEGCPWSALEAEVKAILAERK